MARFLIGIFALIGISYGIEGLAYILDQTATWLNIDIVFTFRLVFVLVSSVFWGYFSAAHKND